MDGKPNPARAQCRSVHLRDLYARKKGTAPYEFGHAAATPRSDPAEAPRAHAHERRHAGVPERGPLRCRLRRHDRPTVNDRSPAEIGVELLRMLPAVELNPRLIVAAPAPSHAEVVETQSCA